MKNIKITFIVFIIITALSANLLAQGVAINESGASHDASAVLDVTSTTKGLLIPRMTATQLAAISSPATGLLVYQTDGTTGFYIMPALWVRQIGCNFQVRLLTS